MNNNFTHRKFKSLVKELSDFFSMLPVLPAGHRFVVNILFMQCCNLLKVTAISKDHIDMKPELKPVFVMHTSNQYKK